MSEPGKNKEPSIRPGIDGHREVKADWESMYNRYTSVHYIMGTLAITFTALAASKFLGHLDVFWQELLLAMSAIITALLTFWRPGERADRYRAAWALLGNQIDRYDAFEADAESVRRACEYGEAMVRFTAPVAMPSSVERTDSGATTDAAKAGAKAGTSEAS